MIFYATYPISWTSSKLFTIFKGGDSQNPSNYRGINIMNALPKLYDLILANRLQSWFASDEEQAGAKHGRGCEEQILTLRLLIDIARKQKYPLYILFVDFEKAYDRVDRKKLIKLLRNMGCGASMTSAIKNTIDITTSFIGNLQIEAEAGVRQGSPSSCFLFTTYVNPMIRMIKEYGQDGWLESLHLLLLMDDTVLLSSTKNGIMWKFQKVLDYCAQFNMKVNEKKTKLLSVNVTEPQPLIFEDITVECCDKYVYLGNIIMNQPIRVQVEEHVLSQAKNIRKFQSFLYKNQSAPYTVKRKVWLAALNNSLTYGAETWWCSNLKMVNGIYIRSLRDMLGVRATTCTDLVYLESGEPSASALIKARQIKYMQKLQSRNGFDDSYICKVINKAVNTQSPMGKYIQQLQQLQQDPLASEREALEIKVRNQLGSTRRDTYMEINPGLITPDIYRKSFDFVPEHHRTAFTRIRLGSHRLRVETGRWSRIPRERRLCPCGQVQDERHALLNCPLTSNLRREFCNLNFHSILTLMTHTDNNYLCKYLFRLSKRIEEINIPP